MNSQNNRDSDSTKIAVISTKLDYLTSSFEKFDTKISQSYVSREEHALLVGKLEALQQELVPLKKFVYGIIGVIGIAVLGGALKVVLR